LCILREENLPKAFVMSRYPHKDLPIKKSMYEGTTFKEKKAPRLGSRYAPLQLIVQTPDRKAELAAICAEGGWAFAIKVDAELDEDIRDLVFLQSKQPAATSTRLAGRNDPCPCGSPKKYKQCCAT
jgi:SWIM/SEC-C metal-binding protein